MLENEYILPTVALRNMCVLPGMVVHFDVKRAQSVHAVEQAMMGNQKIFLVAQLDAEVKKPSIEDIYQVGVIAEIKQIIKMQDNIVRVLVEGKERAHLCALSEEEDVLFATVETYSLQDDELPREAEEAMLRLLKEKISAYATLSRGIPHKLVEKWQQEKNLNRLMTQMSNTVPIPFEQRQCLLEARGQVELYELLMQMLVEEVNVLNYRQEFQGKVKERIDKNQKDYMLREQMKVIREELGEDNTESDIENYEAQLEKLKASKSVKEKIRKEINRLQSLPSSSAESAVERGYIETLLELPWDKASKDNKSMKDARRILNEDHYGMEKVKERILEFLAVRNLTKKGESPIICLVGPPGTGKTSIAKSVAKALDKKYVRICLGGVRDEAEIRGHRRTYVGAMPGRLVTGLKNAGVKNPLMLLDEIDKVSSDYKGDTSSALLEVLDGEQNKKFQDHYVEIPVDLSEVLFIATANSLDTIPRPLLDRMEIIEVSGYTENEKMHIAKDHLIEKQRKKNGLSKSQIAFTDEALHKMITGYTREAGVRNLERKIGAVCRKAAREIYEEEKKRVRLTEKNLKHYLGKVKYTQDKKNDADEVGLVRGLAWTSVGGDTLEIEVNVMPGKGKTALTGQMGDVMKESAQAGISYIRSVAEQYDIPEKFFEEHDIHIHIPEGAVPKDGPSAGITMATAILSAITGRKVKADLAMTGEITLRGRVLPIGGLKEKLLAAKNADITLVLVPEKNRRDIEEISGEILDGLKIVYVKEMAQVIEQAFVTD